MVFLENITQYLCSEVEVTTATYARSNKCEPTCIQKSIENSSGKSQIQFLSK